MPQLLSPNHPFFPTINSTLPQLFIFIPFSRSLPPTTKINSSHPVIPFFFFPKIKRKKRKIKMAAKILMKSQLALLAALLLLATASAADESLSDKCSADFTKVTNCLPFASGKAAAPSKECCGAVTDLRGSDPACLCFVIQQVHNGSNTAVKSMGIQESRLLQLPASCHLVNASISDCPRLLHLPPNSSDAAIFTNASTVSTPVSTPTTSAPTTANHAFRHKEDQIVALIAAISITFSIGFSARGFMT